MRRGFHHRCLDKEDGFGVVGSNGRCVSYPMEFEEIFNKVQIVGWVWVVGIEVIRLV
jgi:hypothetical protein